MPEIRTSPDRVLPVLQENLLVDGFHIVLDLERSHDCTMVDAVSGKEYLDCYSFFATLPLGHNHPKLADPGFQKSLLRAALANPANSDVYCPEFAGFVDVFRRLAVPEPFRYLFFVAGGALAVENAMKTAFDWKVQKNRARGVAGGGDQILHFREAFHGRSGYTLSVTNTDPVKVRDFPKFAWPRVSNPKLAFPPDLEAVRAAERAALAEIEAAFQAAPHAIAAILIEPIQGEGGDNHFRAEFLRELRQAADRHDALLIFDEVQTGLGLTGSLWAYQQFGVTPDLLVFGKKTQVCGLMATRRVDEVKDNVFHVSSRINSTWGGNLADMVRCARYLQVIHEDGLVANAARVGRHFLERLQQLPREFPAVSNVRGRGLMIALDLPDGPARDQVRRRCFDAGLATLGCGTRSLRFRPPLTFQESHADQAVAKLREVLRAMAVRPSAPPPVTVPPRS